MADIINHTEVYCHTCRIPHPARQVVLDGKIIGEVDCPVAPWQTTLSSHAGLFLQFRRQAGFDPALQPPEGRPFYFNYVTITDDCNCRCPVCFAAAGSHDGNTYLSIDEAERIAATAVKNGARSVNIIGGEPTLHPQLLDLINVFRRHNLTVAIATNGLLLARQAALASQLKKAGVSKICLQFDSFDPEIHRAIRGHACIEEKLAAARATTAAGMSLGLVCTVTSHNLPDLAAFCRTALSWPDPPNSIAFQGAAHAGRLTIDQDTFITKEDIVTSLADGNAVAGLTPAQFWAFPVFRPFNIFVHPDCSANSVVVISDKTIEPVSRYIDMDKFVHLAASSPAAAFAQTKNLQIILLLLRSVRVAGISLVSKHLWSRITGKRGIRFCFIGTGAFLRRDFMDMSRIKRCGSSELTAGGCESLCAYHGKRPEQLHANLHVSR